LREKTLGEAVSEVQAKGGNAGGKTLKKIRGKKKRGMGGEGKKTVGCSKGKGQKGVVFTEKRKGRGDGDGKRV